MAEGRVLCALRLLGLVFYLMSLMTGNVSLSESTLLWKPRLIISGHSAAALKFPMLKHSRHGMFVLALPFDSYVPLPAYFAICCDVSLNPGPESGFMAPQSYSRSELLNIGKLVSCAESRFQPDPMSMANFKRYEIFINPPWLVKSVSNTLHQDHCMIPTRISSTRRRRFFTKHGNIANIDNLISLTSNHSDSHINEMKRDLDNGQHLPVRITSRYYKHSSKTVHNARNSLNLININTTGKSHDQRSRVRFATWNIRSINKKAATICDLVISQRIDILAVTETWLSPGNDSDPTLATVLSTLQDFDFLHLPRSMKAGGGVGVFLRKGFHVKQNSTIDFKSMEYMDLTISSSNSSMCFLVVYRPPPSKANKLTSRIFLDEFSILVEVLGATAGGHLIITGDFNFHVDDACNRDAVNFLDLLESADLEQRVIGPTHKRGHTLDLVIVRQDESLLYGSPEVLNYSHTISDHNAILCTVHIPRPCVTKKTLHYRDLRHMDIDSWHEDVKNSALNDARSTCADANVLAEQYNNVLRQLLDSHAPIRTRSVTLRPHTPWFNDNIRSLKRQRRQAERRYVASGLEVHHEMYRERCRIYTDALNSAKRDYYKAKISGSDQNQLFRLIDGLFKVKSVPPLPSHKCPKTLAEDFSNFFHNKIRLLKEQISSSPLATMDLLVNPSQSSCTSVLSEFSEVSVSYICDIVQKSKSKSCVLDPLRTDFLKQTIDVLASPITTIVNASLTSGVFPALLKKGIVRPSIKKQALDREEKSNYRPITNVAFLSKILERVAATQTLSYLVTNGLLAKFQSAYRCFYSTETALLRVFNDILLAIDRRQEVVLVLLDLSSAFDTIDHTALLRRLEVRYGINQTVLKWYKSYLSNRTQQVMIGDALSLEKDLSYGAPQGSVLGPLLFALFFAPLEDVILSHDLNAMMYADDTQLYITIDSLDDRPVVLSKLELCIKDVLVWCTSNGLACNPDKTEVIHLSSRFSSPANVPGININGFNILPQSAARDLGVIIDSHLLMTKHVNNVCKSAFLSIRNIGRIRKYLDQETCEKLVHAFITSKLDSCNSLLAGLPDTEISKLQRVQNTAARLVNRVKKNDNITPVLRQLHWLPVRFRIDFKILGLVYKALHNQAPDYLCELLKQYKPLRSLRSSGHNLLDIPKSNTKTYGDRSFSVYAPRLWNSLPLTLRNSEPALF